MYTTNQKLNMGHKGLLFNDPNNVAALLSKHEGQYKSVGFAAASTVIGLTSSINTVGYFLDYDSDELTVGPFITQANRTTDFTDKYNRGYFVTKQMIEDHISNINNPSYVIPFGIREWPGNGNASIGEAAQLLPYFDQDDNGIYEPELGDYPKIYGDQCAVFIYHQKEELNPVGIECHEYVYNFTCDTSELMRNSFFVNRHYFARNETLSEVYFGNFLDADIGNYGDDYVGTHVNLGMVYGYQGDGLDESSGGNIGFGEYAPVLGMQTLLGAKLPDDGTDNLVGIGINESVNGYGFQDGTPDNEYYTVVSSRLATNSTFYPMSDPANIKEAYYNYQGMYQNGTYPQTFGNDVRMQYFGASDPMHYASFGIDAGTQYTEEDELNSPGDRRIYSGSGPGTLGADTVNIVTAFIVAHDTINAGFDERPLLFSYAQQLKDQFALNNAGCGNDFGFYTSSSNVGLEEQQLEAFIYPNPVKETLHVSLKDTEMLSVKLVSLNGTQVYTLKEAATHVTIDMAGLPSGIYLLQLESALGRVTKKVVKL